MNVSGASRDFRADVSISVGQGKPCNRATKKELKKEDGPMNLMSAKYWMAGFVIGGLSLSMTTGGIAADRTDGNKEAAIQQDKKEIIRDRLDLLQEKKDLRNEVKRLNRLQKELDDAKTRRASKAEIDRLNREVAAAKKEVAAAW
jgi:uncharacterized protein YlxW (UPF0749 family)